MDHSDHHPTLDPSDLRGELVAETCENGGAICFRPSLLPSDILRQPSGFGSSWL